MSCDADLIACGYWICNYIIKGDGRS